MQQCCVKCTALARCGCAQIYGAHDAGGGGAESARRRLQGYVIRNKYRRPGRLDAARTGIHLERRGILVT